MKLTNKFKNRIIQFGKEIEKNDLLISETKKIYYFLAPVAVILLVPQFVVDHKNGLAIFLISFFAVGVIYLFFSYYIKVLLDFKRAVWIMKFFENSELDEVGFVKEKKGKFLLFRVLVFLNYTFPIFFLSFGFPLLCFFVLGKYIDSVNMYLGLFVLFLGVFSAPIFIFIFFRWKEKRIRYFWILFLSDLVNKKSFSYGKIKKRAFAFKEKSKKEEEFEEDFKKMKDKIYNILESEISGKKGFREIFPFFSTLLSRNRSDFFESLSREILKLSTQLTNYIFYKELTKKNDKKKHYSRRSGKSGVISAD